MISSRVKITRRTRVFVLYRPALGWWSSCKLFVPIGGNQDDLDIQIKSLRGGSGVSPFFSCLELEAALMILDSRRQAVFESKCASFTRS